MPIECSVEIRPIDQESFHKIDNIVMGHVFAIHNQLGRFFDERIYQQELAHRCDESGFNENREAQIQVSHKNYLKVYYCDILLENGLIYELKAVENLIGEHGKQLIHYLLLTGLNHGKLINFRSSSVQYQFISTHLLPEKRTIFQVDDSCWEENDIDSQKLRETLVALFNDWGVFLDADLYRDACLYFSPNPNSGIQLVDIVVDGRVMGAQKMALLNDKVAWHLSAIRKHFDSYEKNVVRLLKHTHLEKIQWINLNQHNVTFRTIRK